jgi:hypothetical protein
LDQYISVVEKLQQTRYRHHAKILWNIKGGEPLHFPNLSSLLRKIKEQPSIVRLVTSGDDTYFPIYGILNLIDQLHITYHEWQNDDVFGFILEECAERKIHVSIEIPLLPGKIVESRERLDHYQQLGYKCSEQILYEPDGSLLKLYSKVDCNRILRRDDNATDEFATPVYIDLSKINQSDPVYFGKPCYAGVDWIYIGPTGFASYSQCGGRNERFNVFDPEWQAPRDSFDCNVNQCRHEQDRKKIRILPNWPNM